MKEKLTNTTDFNLVLDLISNAQQNVFRKINEELVLLYWNIGKFVSEKVDSGNWGESIVIELAEFIKKANPNLKGFSKRGLYRMKQFYKTYHKLEKVSTVLTLLKNQVNHTFKDTYVLEFLDLPVNYNEKDLQTQLLLNLKKFLLELGGGFTFVGQEYRVQVGLHDYYIDLLFFHRELNCLVAIELKTTEFKPKHLGKLNFYLEALDSEVKMPQENPSIGILLCKGKDEEVVEFALRRNISPALIADYETKLIDKKILQQKLHDLYQLFDKNK